VMDLMPLLKKSLESRGGRGSAKSRSRTRSAEPEPRRRKAS
jgi:hypothetical protein